MKKYANAAKSLRQDILSGQYPSGNMLPSEHELCARYGISRITARKAFKVLEDEGLIEAIPRKGRKVVLPGALLRRVRGTYRVIAPSVVGIESFFTAFAASCEAGGVDAAFELTPGRQIYEKLESMLADEDTAGLCVMTVDAPPERLVAKIQSCGKPVVMAIFSGEERLHSVSIDYTKACRMLVRHLVEQGHQRIAYVHYSNLDHGPTFRTRLAGYHEAMLEQGLGGRVIEVTPDSIGRFFESEENVTRSLSLDDRDLRVTAMIGCVGTFVSGVALALVKLGYKIPADVSICGFSDMESHLTYSMLGIDQLTTVGEPWGDFGKAAALLLNGLRDDPALPPMQVILPPAFVAGDSTAPPR